MLPTFSTAQFVQDFLKAMLADAGMDKLSPPVQEQMLSDLYARLEDWLFGYIVDALSDEDLTQFRELMENKGTQEQLESFLEQKVPDAKEVFSKAMLDFRKSYLGLEE